MSRTLWVILLAVWLFLWGILAVTNITFQFSGFILGVLAIATSICLILQK